MNSPKQLNRVLLRDHLIFSFTEKEFRAFIDKMGFSYNDLPGQTQRDRATVLIGKMERQNRLPALVAALVEERPGLLPGYVDYFQAEPKPNLTEEERLNWLYNVGLPNDEPPTMKWKSDPDMDASKNDDKGK